MGTGKNALVLLWVSGSVCHFTDSNWPAFMAHWLTDLTCPQFKYPKQASITFVPTDPLCQLFLPAVL